MIRDPNNALVHAEVSTWQGISIGAVHYYVTLKCGDKEVELECVLTERHAARLNKEARQMGYAMKYAPGGKYRGFLEREEAIAAAVAEWRGCFPWGRCLLLGRRVFIRPFRVLEADVEPGVVEALNAVVEVYGAVIDAVSSKQVEDVFIAEWEKLLAGALGLEYAPWE